MGALKGELAATAVNAPMVPAEVWGSYMIALFLLAFRLRNVNVRRKITKLTRRVC